MGSKIHKGKKLFFIFFVCLLMTGCQRETTAQEDIVSKNDFLNMGDIPSRKEEIGEALSELDEALQEEFLNQEAPYIEAYYEFLQEYIKGCSTAERKSARFYLAFIDDDEIPELLGMYDYCHAAGVHVYTYCNDEVVDLGEFGSTGNMQYAEKEGMIESSFTGMGEEVSSYYQMADGEALLICKIHSYPDYSKDDPYTNLLYEIDEVSVSKEEYDKKWKGFSEAFDFITIGYDDGVSIDGADLKSRLLAVRDDIEPKRGSKALQTQVSGQSEVLGAYGIFLDEYAKNWEDYEGEGGPRFSLIYVDEDMIPELVIFDGMAHASFAEVYTYENGETVYIGDYGQYGGGTGYIEGKGIIISEYESSRGFFTTIYQVDGANETVLQSFKEHWEFIGETEEDIDTYFIDGKEVSKEQYDAVSSEWNGLDEKIITYCMCSPILNADRDKALNKVLENLILCQKTALQSRLLVESGMQEDEIRLFEYGDYNYDGKYEAFVVCGRCEEDEKGDLYSGSLWFVGTDVCVRLSKGNYRSIDEMYLGGDQKYICLNNDENQKAVKTEIWTVEDGEPVESPLSGLGELTYDTYGGILAIWTDAEDHFYDPETDLWTGHTYKPCFYRYSFTTEAIESCEGEEISRLRLKQLCSFDLAAEIETEGCEVISIIQWDEKIVTVTYTVPPKEGDTIIRYENVIWDCSTNDYWRKEERGVTSWKDAGVGGRFSL